MKKHDESEHAGALAGRRDLLKMGAIAGITAVVGSPFKVLARADDVQPIDVAVFDDRFADGRAFGAMFARNGVRTLPMSGDITPLWRDELEPQWRRRPMRLAGLTHPSSLVGLELMAEAAGMRVVVRCDMRENGAGKAVRYLEAPQSVAQRITELPIDRSWGAYAARLLVESPASWRLPVCVKPDGEVAGLPQEALSLTAWAIAPVRRA